MRIEVKHVDKVIRGTKILDDVNLSMSGGTVYGFQGVNGSGKTMLMRLISGLIRPTRGQVYVDGKKLGKDIDFPRNTGLLLETPAFLDGYTGYKNLELLAGVRGIADKRALTFTLKRVGLKADDKRKYRKYSLGMKQKLGIAAAIMEQPELLILDEPLNALDTQSAERVKRIIYEEKERGALVVLACHDKETLNELADIIYVIESGQVRNRIVMSRKREESTHER